jgi:myosin-7
LGEPSAAAGGWQVGSSKLFIKDSHDSLLEEKRDSVFNSNALSIQRLIRGALARKRFIEMKTSMTCLQRRFRSHVAQGRGKQLTNGFARLQATVKMSKHTSDFRRARSSVASIQMFAKGMIARDRFQSIATSVEKIQSVFKYILAARMVRVARDEWEAERAKEEAIKQGLDAEEAERQKQEKLAELAARTEDEKAIAAEAAQNKAEAEEGFGGEDFDGDDGAMVDQMFGFADDEEGEDGGETNAFGFEGGIEGPSEADVDGFADSRVRPEDDEDNIMNFKFPKFAGTYFQGNANAFYIRRAIKSPLLNIKRDADKHAAVAVWVTVLRFMGDMPEPKYAGNGGGPQTSVMGKMYKTLGRKSSKNKVDFITSERATSKVAPKEKKSIKKKLISMTLRKKNKMSAEIAAQIEAEKEQAAKDEANEARGGGGGGEDAVMPLQDKPTTNLEKLHYIIGHGILR